MLKVPLNFRLAGIPYLKIGGVADHLETHSYATYDIVPNLVALGQTVPFGMPFSR